jgi:FkbM family methyltransferase
MSPYVLRPLRTARAISVELARGYSAMTSDSFFATFAWDVLAYRRMRLGRIRSWNNRRRIVTRAGTVIHYRRNRGDIQGIREVWLDRVYSLPFNQRPEVVVDLGANIGLTSLFLCERYAPRRVVLVEPDPANAEVLRANVGQLRSQVDIIVAAVGHQDGTVCFAESEESNLGRVSDCGRSVRCISMPTLMKEVGLTHIDLLKIDIEGSEGLLLSKSSDWLEQVGSIMVEFHQNVDEPALIELLRSRGFSYFTCRDVAAFGGKSNYFLRPHWHGLQPPPGTSASPV